MAQIGEEIASPPHGRIIFRTTSEASDGGLLELDAFLPPERDWHDAHYHPNQEERYQVAWGTVVVRTHGDEQEFGQGDTFTLPAGTWHTIHNSGPGQARLIWQSRPALNTEDFVETLWSLGRDGKTNKKGMPGLLQRIVLYRDYQDEVVQTFPPRIAQRLSFVFLSPIARIFKVKASYNGSDEEEESGN